MGFYGWGPYVSVAEKKAKAAKKIAALKKKGVVTQPVQPAGRAIATTFWGKSWCAHLESYSDYDNRLPRGRTYIRNGSVIDLQVDKGSICSLVSGSDIYQVKILVEALAQKSWDGIKTQCSTHITSMLDLLQGKLSKDVMAIVTHKETGLFPKPKQLKFSCSCPDWAAMCKHVAATLYGFGTRLDDSPELLFQLRHVDSKDLISTAKVTKLSQPAAKNKISAQHLSDMFGIELDVEEAEKTPEKKTPGKKTLEKKAPGKKTPEKKTSGTTKKPVKKTTAKVVKKAKVVVSTKKPTKSTAKVVKKPVKTVKTPVKKAAVKAVKKAKVVRR